MMQCVFRPELTGFRVVFSLKHRAETILQLSLIEPWQVSDFSIIFILRDADVINDCIVQCLR